ncbi:TetR/AcrR family transcriptional regulator [Leucobacter iarius]|uniref:TetR/AcrR family transcriptional regulator n=1 Tax=Leucobacter iarius TaxID=333963 RepID=A0ABP4XKC4_9MICO
MSYWDHAKPVRRARAVDIDSLAEAALAVLDDGGTSALTLRAVAAALGVAPPSLYSRVESVDDLFDLALDRALGCDQMLQAALCEADTVAVMLALYRHLLRHPWACAVLGMRPPRGPNGLAFSERLVLQLRESGACEPLLTAYALTNFVLGSATTAQAAAREPAAVVDPSVAPTYATLHERIDAAPESVLRSGISALLASSATRG